MRQILKWSRRVVIGGLAATGAVAVVLGWLLAVPLKQGSELKSITAGVRKVDWSDLPVLQRFQARDGTELAYRVYEPVVAGDGPIALLVHGSAGSSVNVHAVGRALATAGVRAIAVDIRGHGRSGTRGDIAYLGQLDDDMADTVAQLRKAWPTAPIVLAGHSMGGGFVLRTAGSANGALFQRFVLIAPFLDPRAATSKPNEGAAGWAQSDVARIIGITLLRRVGIACCDHLPVIAYALPAGSALHATGQYSYALLTNFGAGLDHRVYLDKVRKPVTVIAGAQDELMFADRYAETMKRPGLDLKVSVMPGVDHMGVLADTAAVDAIVAAVKSGNGA